MPPLRSRLAESSFCFCGGGISLVLFTLSDNLNSPKQPIFFIMPEKTLDSRVVRTVRQLRSNSAYRRPPAAPKPLQERRADNKENIGIGTHSRPTSSVGGGKARGSYNTYSYPTECEANESSNSIDARFVSRVSKRTEGEELILPTDSNKVKEMENALIDNYTDKCEELIRSSSSIKEASDNCEVEKLLDFLFSEKHF